MFEILTWSLQLVSNKKVDRYTRSRNGGGEVAVQVER